jgi:predicted NACHT family NTPase
VRFAPGGRQLASASWDRTARLWDLASGACTAVLGAHWDHVYALAFAPDGTRLATGSRDTSIRIWDTEHGEELLLLRGHDNYVYDLAWSPDGRTLASASGDHAIRLWDSEPVHRRWQARARMQALRDAAEPQVEALRASLADPELVARRLREDAGRSADEREAALQVLLRGCTGAGKASSAR